jgi:hypothetical protein
MKYEGGNIVKPIIPNENYSSIGLFYLKDGASLDYNSIGLLPNDMIVKLDEPIIGDYSVNDFFLLSSLPDGIITVDKSKIFSGIEKNMKLLSTSNKYLTMIDDKHAKNASKHSTSKQTFSYNAQGELMTGGKCLTYSAENAPVYFDSCNDNNTQKWNITGDKIRPSHAFDKCLSVSSTDDNIYLKSCSSDVSHDSDSQHWNTEGSDEDNSSDYILPKFGGKSVVLVQNDNPFYLNKDITIQMPFKKDSLDLIDNIEVDNMAILESGIHADYESSKFVVDPNRPDLGYGYSYASRQGVSCDAYTSQDSGIETFIGGDNNYSDNQIIFILLFIILLIIAYKMLCK